MFQGSTISNVEGGAFYNIQGGAVFNQTGANPKREPSLDDIIDETVSSLERLALVRVEFRKIHEDIVDKKAKGTGELLKAKLDVRRWFTGEIDVLWISGSPGVGKTYTASSFAQWSEELAEERPQADTAVAVIYLRYTEKLTAWDIILSIVIQLVQCSYELPSVTALVRRALDRHRRKRGRPSFDELVQLLKDIVKEFRRANIIIDGLDEMLHHVQWLIVEVLATVEASIFFTSRPSKSLQSKFLKHRSTNQGKVAFLDLVAEDEDLDLFIKSSISRSPSLSLLLERTDALAWVVDAIKLKANGMFLHVALQVELLQRCLSLQQVHDVLASFPSKIEDLYANAVKRIHDGDARLPQLLLMWLLHVNSSITIDDLQYAAAACSDTYRHEPNRVVAEEDLVSACYGLITVEMTTRQARLVHYTAYEILLDLLEAHPVHPHEVIAETCLARLQDLQPRWASIQTLDDLRACFAQCPLFEYAYNNTGHHIRQRIAASKCLDVSADHFVRQSPPFPYAPKIEDFPPDSGDFNLDRLDSLHLATLFGLPKVVRKLLTEEGVDVNLRAQHPTGLGWTSLMIAAAEGHAPVLELLLSTPDVDVNAVHHTGYTALHEPCYQGYEDIVRILCQVPGIDPNVINSDGNTPLLNAAGYQHLAVVKILLRTPGIDPNIPNSVGNTPLAIAAHADSEAIVEALLSFPGIDVNVVGQFGQTALINAAGYGFLRIVQMLLQVPDIDLNQTEEYGYPPLLLAVSHGHDDVVQTILSHPGVDPNQHCPQQGMTSLILACILGLTSTIDLLLKTPGLDPKQTTFNGASALMAAAKAGRAATIRQLLAAVPDFDYNQVAQNGSTALMCAVEDGYLDVIEVLLGLPGIEVNHQNGAGITGLMSAATQGDERVVSMLVATPRVDVNLVDERGVTALVYAAAIGAESVVRVLLGVDGIDVNLQVKEGWSAAMRAAYRGHTAVLTLLIEHPRIDLGLKMPSGETILHFVLVYHLKKYHGEESHVVDYDPQPVALLLLDNPQVQGLAHWPDEEGRTTLMVASSLGYVEVVGRLLGIPGVDVEAVMKDGRTAMDLALEHGHEAAVERLSAVGVSG